MRNQGSSDTDEKLTGRIAVLRDQHLVPLLATRQVKIAANQPWNDVLLEQHLVVPGEIPEHEHPDLCLHLQTSGSDNFEWWFNGRNAVEPTRPGSLILIPPGTRDRLRWSGRSERLILSVKQHRLAALAEALGHSKIPEFHSSWAFFDSSLANLLAEMGREARADWPLGSLYADLLALTFETHLLRTHAVSPIAVPPRKGGLSMAKLRQAMEYINANLAEDLRLESIASQLHLSPSHFAHEFRDTTAQTPYQYLLDQRIARAKNLLKSTRLPVQFISDVTGFGSPVNFVRAFRQRVGRTPAAWRKSV